MSSRVAQPLREARQGPVEFSREAWAELRKVTWPSRETVLRLTLITPIALEEGLRFAIREGGKTVGAGVVTKILE